MEPEIKKLKIEGVAPKTPPTSDSEEELPIEQIREHRRDKAKREKEKKKEAGKKQMREFRISLALFRAAEGGYYEDLTKGTLMRYVTLFKPFIADERKTMRRKKEPKKKGLDKNTPKKTKCSILGTRRNAPGEQANKCFFLFLNTDRVRKKN